MSAFTAGPLYVDPFSAERAVSTNYGGIVLDSVQSALTREECEANVAEAVRRWNSHEDLLAGAEIAIAEACACVECGGPGERYFDTEGDGHYWLCASKGRDHSAERYMGEEVDVGDRPLDALRAAIAKAGK